MKRERSRDNDWFVSPVVLPSGQSSIEPRRIFVFKDEERLAGNNGPDKTVQRILIFDNHPETLHLLFGRGAGAGADPEGQESTRWWEPALCWVLAGGVLLLLLLWLFLKLRS
jgi:hypothetical protein